MEVKLHHHAVPVLVVLAAVFVLAFVALTQPSGRLRPAAETLFGRQPKVQQQSANLSGATEAGSRAQMSFKFQ